MRYIIIAVSVVLIVGCVSSPKLPDEPQALIELLAETSDEFAPKQALSAHDKLVGMGTAAFPALLENRDDKREAGGFRLEISVPTTVGMVCACIIQEEVEVNIPKGFYNLQFLGFLPDKEELSLWWKERSGRTLYELQVEAALFSLALARYEKIQWAEERFVARLKELGVDDVESKAAPFVAKARMLTLPDDPQTLIDLFEIKGETYIERRFAAVRAEHAWLKLYKMGINAFPALVSNVDREQVGDRCLRLIQWQVEVGLSEDQAKFRFLSKEMAAEWWKARSGRTLKELQIEAAKHSLAAVQKAEFKDEEEKQRLVDWITSRLKELGAGPKYPSPGAAIGQFLDAITEGRGSDAGACLDPASSDQSAQSAIKFLCGKLNASTDGRGLAYTLIEPDVDWEQGKATADVRISGPTRDKGEIVVNTTFYCVRTRGYWYVLPK
jgi:hypothetical protein